MARPAVQMNSQWLGIPAQDLCRLQTDKKIQWWGEGHKVPLQAEGSLAFDESSERDSLFSLKCRYWVIQLRIYGQHKWTLWVIKGEQEVFRWLGKGSWIWEGLLEQVNTLYEILQEQIRFTIRQHDSSSSPHDQSSKRVGWLWKGLHDLLFLIATTKDLTKVT